MLRTLAAYVGVAFDNAEAYRQLKSTQAQLVAQEKLAALGSLVAGVAHELNTPIGNSLLMASTLQEKTETIAAKFEGAAVRRSDLQAFIAASQEAAALIMRSLFNAAELVNSFKQVAVDQASAQRRPFNLEQATHEIVATMMNQVRKAGHTLEMTVPPQLEMDSFPGPYGQVLINLINNALLHAFEGRSGGAITIAATAPVPGRVQISFHDDGIGIAPEHQARIFDPFFTTKMGQGGSGLGLNITYNIVTSLLQGQIRVESSARGTTFVMDLPLQVTPAPLQHTV
jgi:signal transduction histidine kinase